MFALMVCVMFSDGVCKMWAQVEGLSSLPREKCESAKEQVEANDPRGLVLECRERKSPPVEDKPAASK